MPAKTKDTQAQTTLILNHLKEGGVIDRLDALAHFRVYNLPSVIMKLRKKGHPIMTIPAYDPYGGLRCVYQYDRSVHR